MLSSIQYVFLPFMAMGLVAAVPMPQSTYTHSNSTSVPAPVAMNATRAGQSELITSLLNAATAVDRLKLLPNPSDHVYDFNQPPVKDAITTGLGGHTVKADRKEFPALIGNGVSMTVGFIGPCGFNTPHTHPRSSEINIVVQGALGTEYILENGAPLIRNRLDTLQMTIFPQGAIHTEWNPDCDDAVFVAGFANEDPGVQQSAQRLFDLDDDLLEATFDSDFTFDGRDIDQFKHMIPANVAKGVESCLAKCGIYKR